MSAHDKGHQNLIISEIVSMIKKYHNHKLQTNPWQREEEPHNNHETPGRQTKQSNQVVLVVYRCQFGLKLAVGSED